MSLAAPPHTPAGVARCPRCGTFAPRYYHVPGDGCWDCRRPHFARLDRRDDRDDAPPPAVRLPIVLRVRPNPRPTRARERGTPGTRGGREIPLRGVAE